MSRVTERSALAAGAGSQRGDRPDVMRNGRREPSSARIWDSYHSVLAEIPAGQRVADCVVSLVWTLVVTGDGQAGIAVTYPQGVYESGLPGTVAGSDLRTAAGWVTSWNYYEASLGCAAVNAAVNTRERLEGMTGRPLEELAAGGRDLFTRLAERFAGGRAAVVGHFPAVERLAATCELTVLERQPQAGDTPDPACEYILPQQDLVCITGTTVTNKTLPRLLELSRRAFTVLVGPSTPLSPVWFDYGVDVLAGAVVVDPERVRRCVQEGAHRPVFREGLLTVEIAAADVLGRATPPGGRGGHEERVPAATPGGAPRFESRP